ncbi:Exodeoxyribonuclease III [Klebsiella aerogenes]|nr:Exodeoxyribonuclease III [Klebsiella aerogenes]
MKFISFNINGLRARPHQLAAIVDKHQPDVIGLQETKVHDDMFPLEEVAKLGYNVFYHGQKGHYGVALLTKETPIAVRRASRATAKMRNAASSWRKFPRRLVMSR